MPPGSARIGRPLRVLVADDNCDAADSTAMLLKWWGIQAEAAYDGKSALQAVRVFYPDVLLLDISMPIMDGFQLAQEVRRHDEDLGKPALIAVTAYDNDEVRRRSWEAGFDMHFLKPITPAILQRVLADIQGIAWWRGLIPGRRIPGCNTVGDAAPPRP
jgi:CheY-like chemotaxis protein